MSSHPTSAEAPSEESKSQRVYNYLRRRIRDLDIPPGTPLRKNEIALECGVSRAPVSEAIARLSAEGLVDVFPQSGSFVSPIRVEDVRESMFIRLALEVEAVRRVTRFADRELLQRLEANIQAQAKALQHKRLDAALYDDLDEALHAEIIAALHSPRAQHQLEAARVLLDRPRFLALEREHRPEDTFAEHRRIVEAIGTGDPDLAAAAMRIHLANVAAAMEARLAQMEEDHEHED
jgi:GntR family transcriptional regulator, rspAB operon transcriptional repressor